MTLTYRDRGTSGTQLDVLSGTVVVCSLRKAMMSTDTVIGRRREQRLQRVA